MLKSDQCTSNQHNDSRNDGEDNVGQPPRQRFCLCWIASKYRKRKHQAAQPLASVATGLCETTGAEVWVLEGGPEHEEEEEEEEVSDDCDDCDAEDSLQEPDLEESQNQDTKACGSVARRMWVCDVIAVLFAVQLAACCLMCYLSRRGNGTL